MQKILLGFLFFSTLLFNFSAHAIEQKPVVLISIDGFARNYLDQYPTKNLHKLMKMGLTADALLPVFPSKTFPNHLSIITGVYPAKHGIIHNSFYNRDLKERYSLGDGRKNSAWLTAKPLWVIAEQNNIKSAVYFWPESEAKVQGVLPSYNFPYNKSTPNIDRVNQIITWLKLPQVERPKFIAGYFSIVDTAGHHYGRNSPELAHAVKEADDLIGILVSRITKELKNNVNLIIVSDHGMVQLNKKSIINWQIDLLKDKDVKVINGQTQLLIYSKNKPLLTQLEIEYKQISQGKYEVYNSDNFPTSWHWQKENVSIPDLILDANIPYVFKSIKSYSSKATHGFDATKAKNLNAIFIANGSSFKPNTTIKAFENVNIAPLVLHLLNIPPPNVMDGSYRLFAPFLIEKINE